MWEDEAWLNCHNEDLWIFDKLILAKKLGYVCGPIGVDVPEPGYYIVRPCVNIMGMGIGATVAWLEGETDVLVPGFHMEGYFWCEIFEGRHLSVDYKLDNKQRIIAQDLTVEGFRKKEDPLWKFNKWKRVDDIIPVPQIFTSLRGNYEYINCEYIDDKLVEVHLRQNSDMGDSNEIIPVWEGDVIQPPNGFEYVENRDYKRLGFYKNKYNND